MIAAANKPKCRRLGGLALGLCTLLALSACGGDTIVRGNMPDVEEIAAIDPGIDTRDDVVERLGSPSALSSFLDRKWYYIGQTTHHFAFLKPEVVDRSVLMVSFDGTGKVEETVLYTLNDGQNIDPVSRKTPTEGKKLTILQQLFGNLGRFPTEKEPTF